MSKKKNRDLPLGQTRVTEDGIFIGPIREKMDIGYAKDIMKAIITRFGLKGYFVITDGDEETRWETNLPESVIIGRFMQELTDGIRDKLRR